MKKLVVFDLDGTLAESKSSLDAEMSKLLHDLLGVVKVAVISGGDWPQFEKQVLSHLPHDQRLENLSLLPTCGTKFFRYSGDWKKIYSEDFTADEKKKIIDADSVVRHSRVIRNRSGHTVAAVDPRLRLLDEHVRQRKLTAKPQVRENLLRT